MPTHSRPAPSLGESHRVEIDRAEPIGPDFLVSFRDLDRPHRNYQEPLSRGEAEGLAIGDRGILARVATRAFRGGRWMFTPEGRGGHDGG